MVEEDRSESTENRVEVLGKISKVERLRYLPSGEALLDFTIAVRQEEKTRVGYLPAFCRGPLAEDLSTQLKLGERIILEGELWSREFRNSHGKQQFEMRVLVKKMEKEKK